MQRQQRKFKELIGLNSAMLGNL